MTLGTLIDEVMEVVIGEAVSPLPGFFTVVAIAGMLLRRGWEAKKETSEGPQFSKRQLLEIERYLAENYEVKRQGRRKYYGGNKRR